MRPLAHTAAPRVWDSSIAQCASLRNPHQQSQAIELGADALGNADHPPPPDYGSRFWLGKARDFQYTGCHAPFARLVYGRLHVEGDEVGQESCRFLAMGEADREI